MKKYKIWEFNFYLGSANNFGNDEMTYFNFVVKKEQMFLRIIYDQEELESLNNIKNIENHHKSIENFIEFFVFRNEFYTRDSDIQYVEHNCVKYFTENYRDLAISFDEIFDKIESGQIKNLSEKQKKKIYQNISSVYSKIMCFPENKFEISTIVTKDFFSNVINLMYEKEV